MNDESGFMMVHHTHVIPRQPRKIFQQDFGWSFCVAIVTFRGLALRRKKTSETLFECTCKNDE